MAGTFSQWSRVESSGPAAVTCGAAVFSAKRSASRSVHG
jgi:hypothetical protein